MATDNKEPTVEATEQTEDIGYLSDEVASDDGQLVDGTERNGEDAAEDEDDTPLIMIPPTDDDESFDNIVARAGLTAVNSEEYRKEASASMHDKMMTLMNQTYSNEDDKEEARLEAEAIAKQLLGHLDVPAMTRVHAQMVLGCSEDEDALGFMRDAVALLKAAMEDGEIENEEGEKMIKTCVALIGTEAVLEVAAETEREEPFDG